jgi:hypothetical protein
MSKTIFRLIVGVCFISLTGTVLGGCSQTEFKDHVPVREKAVIGKIVGSIAPETKVKKTSDNKPDDSGKSWVKIQVDSKESTEFWVEEKYLNCGNKTVCTIIRDESN